MTGSVGWLAAADRGVWVSAVDGDNAWLVTSDRQAEFVVDSAQSRGAEPGQAFAVNARLRVGVGVRATPELVCFDAEGREIEAGSTLVAGPTTTPWQELRCVFPVLPGTASVRARLRAEGCGEFRVAKIEIYPVDADPYRTGALIKPPDPYVRNGLVLESNHGIVNPDVVCAEDRDGDGKWALVERDLDELTQPAEEGVDWRSRFEFPPNELLWSDGVVLKSDSVWRDREPDIARAVHFRMPVHEDLYEVFVSDPGRTVAVSIDGKTWTRYEGGTEVALGQLPVADGVVKLWVDACYRDQASPEPAYFDYVRLVPSLGSPNVARLAAAARQMPVQLTCDGVDERTVDVAVCAPVSVYGANWPVRCGLPIPQGELSSARHVKVLDAHGIPVPVQTRTMARWPDRSIKWLYLDFQHDLRQGGDARYTVTYGRVSSGPAPTSSVQVQATDAGLEVDTSAIRFLVPHDRFGLIENVRRADGSPVQRHALAIELVEADGLVWDVSALPVERVELEQAGPLHAVIVVETRLAESGQPSSGFHHRARIHAYAGSPLVQLDYFVANTDSRPAGDLGGSMSSQVTVRSLAMKLTPTASVTEVAHDPGRSLTSGAVVKTSEVVVESSEAGDDRELDAHLPGWLAAKLDDGGTVVVGVEGLREQYPKALRRRSDAMEIGLWAAEGVDFAWIEGFGKTHRISLHYGTGDSADSENLDDGALVAQAPVLALADPDWYSASGAFGRQVPAPASGLLAVEQALADHIIDRVVAGVGLGFENYGDHSSHGYVKDTFLWDNNEYDLPAACMVHFTRTGDRDALRLGLASAVHYLDTDIIHYSSRHSDWAGAQHVHSHDTFGRHTAQGPNFGHAGYAQGLIWYTYFTGDPVGVHGAQGIADWVLHALPPELGMERVLGHPLMTLAHVYAATGEDKHLRGAAQCADLAVKWENPVRSGWLARITESPAYYAGSPFCSGLLSSGLITFNSWAKSSELDQLLERIARWTLTDVWRPPDGILHKGGSPRERAKPFHVASHGHLMSYIYERTQGPLYLVVPRGLIEQAFHPKESGFGTRATGLVFNHLPQFLALLCDYGNPRPDPGLRLQVTPRAINTTRGGTVRITITIENIGTGPVRNLRLSLHPRLDFAVTPIDPVPRRLGPEQLVKPTFELTAPEQLNLTCSYNRISYAHISMTYHRQETAHTAHALHKVHRGMTLPGSSPGERTTAQRREDAQ